MNNEEINEANEIANVMYNDMQAKSKLLEKLKAESKVIDELTIGGADLTVNLLYLGKLIEGGFIEMDNAPSFSAKGFDLAMDLIEAGWKLNMFEAIAVCSTVFQEMDEEAHMEVATLVCEMQRLGIDGMNQFVIDEDAKAKEDDKSTD